MSFQSRRNLLKLGLGLAAVAVPGLGATAALANAPVKRIALHNLHTGDALDAVYWERGAYLPDVLARVNHVLRDFRTGDTHPMNPRLLDLLDILSARLEARAPFQVISGYRSPKTNAMLHRETPGVASQSLHMQGMAIDIRLPGTELGRLHRAALSLNGGGVGYYPQSDFVHVDVGPVRCWG